MSSGRVSTRLDEVEELTGLYERELGTLDADELNWKPAPEVWSVGQNVDHVIRTNESYYPIVERLRRGVDDVPWIGRIGFIRRIMRWLVTQGVEPGRRRKIDTFPVFAPTDDPVPDTILDRFVQHQREFGRLIRDSADLVTEGAVISSPVSRWVVYELGSAFDLLLAHERRHLNQCRETLERLRGASPA